MKLNPVGIDLSKSVFQLSLADGKYRVVARKRLSRRQFHRWLATTERAHLVMEACGTSHHWGRLAQSHGHQVTLLHAKYVKAYVRRHKTDSADADALLQAVQDDQIKPVPVKDEDRQALQSVHQVRERWKSTRVASLNTARALLAEFGICLPKAVTVARLRNACQQAPELLRHTLDALIDDIEGLEHRLKQVDRDLKHVAAHDVHCQRLMQVNGVGVTIATAAVARVPHIHGFRSGRSFAGWLGLTAREYSSGGTRRLGRISKQGDRYLRTLIIHGARAALLAAKRKRKHDKPITRLEQWALNTEARVGHNKATVAMANKMARILWAVWTRQTDFNGDDAMRFAA